MRPEPSTRIDVKAIKMWKLAGAIDVFISLFVFAGLIWITLKFELPWFIPTIAGLLILIQILFQIQIIPQVRWKRWKYEVSELDIELLHGIIVRRRTVIPMVRIQHVDTKQGPLLRRFKLANVTFSTAAGSHEIPAVSEAAADELRIRIADLARVSDEDV